MLYAYDWDKFIKVFNENWDFSYLTKQEMLQVLNFPIKIHENKIGNIVYNNTEELLEENIFLVIIKKSDSFDYTMLSEFADILNNNNICLNFESFMCNFKYAAVLSGLGQYAKNSLVYHKRFNFDFHIEVVKIKQNPFTLLPDRHPYNFQLLDMCENCDDCLKACPAQAIHFNGFGSWVDIAACDNFNHFNNHPTIPSIKENWAALEASYLSPEEIKKITSFKECLNITKKPINTRYVILGFEKFHVKYPVCRECCSQLKCSKYNGNFPYLEKQVEFYKQNQSVWKNTEY